MSDPFVDRLEKVRRAGYEHGLAVERERVWALILLADSYRIDAVHQLVAEAMLTGETAEELKPRAEEAAKAAAVEVNRRLGGQN